MRLSERVPPGTEAERRCRFFGGICIGLNASCTMSRVEASRLTRNVVRTDNNYEQIHLEDKSQSTMTNSKQTAK